jgi:DNA-3-methyladenine glycosylase
VVDEERRLDRAFFEQSVLEVARQLIGCTIHSRLGGGKAAGRIVEAEAYADSTDLASHAARLKQGRVELMSGEPGHAYVYRSHGLHAMLNFVSEPIGRTSAVLIRALEPTVGIELMRRRRSLDKLELLCSGPGRLCQALGIALEDHGIDIVTSDRLWVEYGPAPVSISAGPRIGISKATGRPWRFFETGSRFVSAHRRGVPLNALTDVTGDTISAIQR